MQHGDTVVFVEVRYRGSERFGGALATVNAPKQARLVRAAQHYLQASGGLVAPPARFDVVAISAGENGADRIEWIADAFGAPW